MLFLSAPRVSTTFTFLFFSTLECLLFPPSEVTVVRFASRQVAVSVGVAVGVFGCWEDGIGRFQGGVLHGYRCLHQDGCSLGLAEGDMVDEGFQYYDFLCVVGCVQVGDRSIPTHHVGIAEVGCSGG